MTPRTDFAYFNVRKPRTNGDVYRTLEIGPSGLMLIDLDEAGHVLGIETLGNAKPDWLALVADDRCHFWGTWP